MKLLTLAVLLLPAVPTGRAAAQANPQRVDSLERELRALRARIDSLEALVQRLTRQGRDTAAAVDELAALRAAAQAAADRPDSARPEAAGQQPTFVDRGRNLNLLNPEISVTGDIRFHATREEPLQDNVEIREFEFSFQSALDPYSSTKIFASFEEGAVEIEEAYAYWTALPGRLRLDIGRFRQQMGELNRWHSHALPESEYPLVVREFTGEEGLIGNGLGLYWMVPAGGGALGTHELWGQVTLADNEPLFDGGNRVAVLGHVNNFWQLGRSSFAQAGATAMYGENGDAALKTRLLGADVRFSWRPPARALYRSFTLRAEGYALTREIAGVAETRYGGYVGAQYQLGRRWYAGARYDYVDLTPDTHQWIMTPHLTWWQSEWVYLRAEWQRQAVPVAGLVDHSDRFVIQAVWAIGPHKHETY
jgi:hypothetical protein